jgi:LAGLIDADG DNA endonuclease family
MKNSQRIHSIIFGTLLGDAHCNKQGCVRVEQASKSREYVYWLFEELESVIGASSPKYNLRFDKRFNKHFETYSFYTSSIFKDYRHIFYKYQALEDKEIKRLPDTDIFKEKLDEVALTIWYLDDGGRANGVRNGVFLTLDSFTPEEVKIIQETIFSNFGIKTSYQKAGRSKSGKLQHRIYIGTKNYPIFYKLAYPIISQIPCMHYKLPECIVKKEK